MTVYAQTIVDIFQTQAGDRYIYGAEVSLDDPDPKAHGHALDCSEGVQWACARCGVQPAMPDGSAAQLAHCKQHGTLISIDEAIRTAGALLFIQKGSERHVAMSRGNGTTIEARGRAYGVGNWATANRPWTHAAKIPGVDYGAPPAPPHPATAPPEPLCRVLAGRGQVYHPEIRGWSVQPYGTPWWEFREIQHHCNRHGITDGRGNALLEDGIGGDITSVAIFEAQKRAGLKLDGVVGPATWRWLRA